AALACPRRSTRSTGSGRCPRARCPTRAPDRAAERDMEIGVRIPHTGPGASPELIAEWCRTADDAGIDIVWGIDHVVTPEHVESPYVLGRVPVTLADGAVTRQMSPNFELVTTLAYVAAVT